MVLKTTKRGPIIRFESTTNFQDIITQYKHLMLHLSPWHLNKSKAWVREDIDGRIAVVCSANDRAYQDKGFNERGFILHGKDYSKEK